MGESVDSVVARLRVDSTALAKDVESLKQDGRDFLTKLHKAKTTNDSLVQANKDLQHVNDSLNNVFNLVYGSFPKDTVLARIKEMQKIHKARIDSKDSIIRQKDTIIRQKDTEIGTWKDSILRCEGKHYPWTYIDTPTGATVLIIFILAVMAISLKRSVFFAKGNTTISVGGKRSSKTKKVD